MDLQPVATRRAQPTALAGVVIALQYTLTIGFPGVGVHILVVHAPEVVVLAIAATGAYQAGDMLDHGSPPKIGSGGSGIGCVHFCTNVFASRQSLASRPSLRAA